MPAHGSTQLRRWMKRHKLSGARVGRELGITRAYVSLLRGGQATPSVALAADIEALTGGAVPMQAWSFRRPVVEGDGGGGAERKRTA